MDKTFRTNFERFGFRSVGGRDVSVSVYTVDESSIAETTLDGKPREVGEGLTHESAIRASLGVVYGQLAVNQLRKIRERRLAAEGNPAHHLERR